jgi:hypothetical protein
METPESRAHVLRREKLVTPPVPNFDPESYTFGLYWGEYDLTKYTIQRWSGIFNEQERYQLRTRLFMFAADLLAYGCLDGMEDILDILPEIKGERYAQIDVDIVEKILPLPPHLTSQYFPQEQRIWYDKAHFDLFVQWFREHRDQLEWHEAEGKFVLKPDEA